MGKNFEAFSLEYIKLIGHKRMFIAGIDLWNRSTSIIHFSKIFDFHFLKSRILECCASITQNRNNLRSYGHSDSLLI